MLLDCPIGFTLNGSTNQCVCDERLQRYTNSCNINNGEITCVASDDFWVGVDYTNGTERPILHPHCPCDQIQSKPMLATLNDIVESTGNNTLLVTTLMVSATITD